MKVRSLLPDVVRTPATDSDHPFYSLQREMNNLFDNFFRGFSVGPRGFAAGMAEFIPSVDVKENDKEFIIKAELPGVEEKDIDVTVTNNSVAIKGEKKEEKEDKDKSYYYMERSYGSFCRVIPLQAEIESGKAHASFKNGILDIKIPKNQKAKEKGTKISIKTS
ncbi:small heat shock protein [hydrocarbon metagenome]|uniref:Small heat shock protein n=1 Tax=hydrocarbon metagenome TaxID=938273 RepID=A0A0W8FKV3_9ZZZZ